MRPIKIFLLAAGALVGSVADVRAVHACTAMLKPVVQVIRESQTIVRALVVGPGITLRVLEVIKGAYDRPFVTVPGQIRDYASDPARRPPYEQIGDCFARSYKDGAQYLLLLRGGTPYWAPLSPTNEEVAGPDDPWVVWVKRQVGIATGPRGSPPAREWLPPRPDAWRCG